MEIQKYAEYLLKYYVNDDNNITPMKLQKLLYYIKVWGLVDGEGFISESFVHHKYGPLNWDIYHEYNQYGNQKIEQPVHDVEVPENKHLVDFIIENYIDFDAITLSSMTHSEDPWKNTQIGEVITDEVIYEYYKEQPFAKNFPFDPNKTFYPIMSDGNHSFIFDMNAEDAKTSMKFSSYSEYLKLKNIAKEELESAGLKNSCI